METKHNYQAPSVKVVSFKVEMGQVVSPTQTDLNIGDDATTPPTTGTSLFETTTWTI